MPHAQTIGQLARVTGVSAKTIRYYEQLGVLPAPSRTAAGYRRYTDGAVQRVQFVRRARALGLPLRQLATLTGAFDGTPRTSMRPRLLALVRAQSSAVRQQIAELELLQRQLDQVLHRLLGPAPENCAGGCRCLEAEG